MDPFLHTQEDNIRISNSPRRSPQITQAVTSQVKSVHPQLQGMDSISSQPDFAHRTTDFCEDSSGEESLEGVDPSTVAPDIDLLDRRGSASKKRRTASTVEPFATQCESKSGNLDPASAGYQRLTPSAMYASNHVPGTAASSVFNGSVDELLPNSHDHPTSPRQKRTSRIASGRTPRNSTYIDQSQHRQSIVPASIVDPTLGAYAIGFELTVDSLMRNPDALDRCRQSFALAPMPVGDRSSLPAQLMNPRSPSSRRFSSVPTSKKTVHVVPPPIDTTATRHSLPADIVRTPYPFSPDNVRRKDFTESSPPLASATTTSSTESILTLSIRRSNPNSKLRMISLTIPASNDYTAVRGGSLGSKERHFRALDFDDAELFHQIRRSYRELSGPIRFFSARSLKRIAVCGPATKTADFGYGWRSPRILAYKGLSDSFSEEQILQHYRKPALGRSRYAFVQWAHRLTAAPMARTPQSEDENGDRRERDSLSQLQNPEELESVVVWSVPRILTALAVVFVLAVATVLLWTFLGKQTPGTAPSDGGFRDAGDRVATGLLIGICVLMGGLSGMAGWLGVSWLLM